jgi:hypothetical protein
MPATAAASLAVRDSEEILGIEELLDIVLTRVRYVTARNGTIL